MYRIQVTHIGYSVCIMDSMDTCKERFITKQHTAHQVPKVNTRIPHKSTVKQIFSEQVCLIRHLLTMQNFDNMNILFRTINCSHSCIQMHPVQHVNSVFKPHMSPPIRQNKINFKKPNNKKLTYCPCHINKYA